MLRRIPTADEDSAAALIMLAATVTILIKHIENFIHMADGTETGVLGALKKSK